MKINKQNIIIAFMGIIILGTSCKKELNQGPIDATYSQVFWTSQANVEEAANAMYGQLRAALRATGSVDQHEGAFFVAGDLVAGTFNLGSGDTFLGYSLTPAKAFNFSYIPYWEDVMWDWSRFYQVIALCNSMLQFVPDMSTSLFSGGEAQKNSYLAEAYFIRAYCYFYITRVWGDPVYVTKTYNDVDFGNIPPIPRSPEKNVLDSCLIDLRTAQSYMDYSGGDPSKSVRANKGSIQALMANIFAWEHNNDSTHYYCQQVINNGGYALESGSNYTNIWKGMSSSESIFELAMLYNADDPNFKSGNSWAEANFNFFATFLQGTIVDKKRSSGWTTNAALYTDTTHDIRFKTILTRVNTSAQSYMLTKYANFMYGDPSAKSYPCISNDLVLMRLPEMYLLDAEALTNKGDLGDARDQLKVVEQRAGISSYQKPQSQDSLLAEIVREEGREFIGEGHYFFDLIRNNDQIHFLEDAPSFYDASRVLDENKGYYWPLDLSTLLNQDPLLVQNPWWATHANR